MAEVVSQKFWVKISREEIEAIIRTIVPDKMCDFDLIGVRSIQGLEKESHLVTSVTFELSYKDPKDL